MTADKSEPSMVFMDSKYFLTSYLVICMTLKASLIFSPISLILLSTPPAGISNLCPKNESQILKTFSLRAPES